MSVERHLQTLQIKGGKCRKERRQNHKQRHHVTWEKEESRRPLTQRHVEKLDLDRVPIYAVDPDVVRLPGWD